MTKTFKIYAENEEIYVGNFEEVPDHYRDNLIEALVDWGDCLSKGGLNELLYSSFHWYKDMKYYCDNCRVFYGDKTSCEKCGKELDQKYVHRRDNRIERLLECIGMINRVEIIP